MRLPARPATEARRIVELSRQLSEVRLNQGIPMGTLARTLGCSVPHLERMETGRTALSAAALVEWVLALNLDLAVQPRRGWPGRDDRPAESGDARLAEAFRSADDRTREAVAVMLGLDRPPAPPVRLTRTGRPPAARPAPRSLRLTIDQIDQLRRSPVPFTGNRVVTALKLADATITQLAAEACLRYSRVTRIVNGRARTVPASYAAEIAACFGCVLHDLFPPGALYPTAGTGETQPAGAGVRAAG